MREHQIVITLKPEQFQEVQRLSRAAGAKSMGMFVRQKLLLALGLEGSPPIQKKEAEGQDLTLVLNELKRLHAELKTFVGESLAINYLVEAKGQTDTANVGDENMPGIADDLPVSLDEQRSFASGLSQGQPFDQSFLSGISGERGFSQESDELEILAKKTFAASPRLGAFESLPSDTKEGAVSADQVSAQTDPLVNLLAGEESVSSAEDSVTTDNKNTQEADVLENTDEYREDEEQTFEVKLPFAEKPVARQTEPSPKPSLPPVPPSPPLPPSRTTNLGFSGGPPPRKRQ